MSVQRAVRREELARARWIKSSRSGTGGGNCVEVAGLHGGRRALRDSKDPAGPTVILTAPEWIAFIGGVRAGEFD